MPFEIFVNHVILITTRRRSQSSNLHHKGEQHLLCLWSKGGKSLVWPKTVSYLQLLFKGCNNLLVYFQLVFKGINNLLVYLQLLFKGINNLLVYLQLLFKGSNNLLVNFSAQISKESLPISETSINIFFYTFCDHHFDKFPLLFWSS